VNKHFYHLDTRTELIGAEERPDVRPAVTAVFFEPDSGLWCLPDKPSVDDGRDRLLVILRAVSLPLSLLYHSSLSTSNSAHCCSRLFTITYSLLLQFL